MSLLNYRPSVFEEDGLDVVRAVWIWPKIMLAAGPRTPPITQRPAVRPMCPIISRSVVAFGSWTADGWYRGLTWGLPPRCRGSRSTRGPCRPRSAAASMLLPHTGNASTFSRVFYRVLPAQTVIVHNQ